jgi:hypothetical protein
MLRIPGYTDTYIGDFATNIKPRYLAPLSVTLLPRTMHLIHPYRIQVDVLKSGTLSPTTGDTDTVNNNIVIVQNSNIATVIGHNVPYHR